MKLLFRFLIAFALIGFIQEKVEAQYYIKGKQFALYRTVIEYSIVPVPTNVTYNWTYSDTTIQFLEPQDEDTMRFFTYFSTNSGTISCELRDAGNNSLIQVVTFRLTVNKNYVDVSSLANLSAQCANINNNSNLCQTNYIDYFELKDIQYDNNGCLIGGYQDLTESGLTTSLDMGFNYTIKLKPKTIFLNAVGEPSKLYYGVWLDYNNDGDFDDPGEFIKDGESNQSEANLINIEVLSNNTFAGSRRLRVAMNSTSGFDPSAACSVISLSGEVEDYLVTINEIGALYGPNLLTPNNDGYNDFLVIKGIDPDKSKSRILEVFDSYGHKVRSIEEYQNDYNGTDKDGNLLNKGIYYYYFTNESRKLKSFFEIKY